MERLQFRMSNYDEQANVINQLIDKINELVSEVNILKSKDDDDDDEFGPGEIGWNNGEFYK